ncbi:MAG: tripartite tricarboxylate transporter substrate binding protein [Acetobacteraceae bacterium]|nr:tripartite tricarboxylate transporter substrate binding protein [Acetobacteraceae bacterium]MCX7684471.1 tripartite tricarboxylate transporter substrate binding protein [Acetobacteraceae bacterium]MDW8397767.1 tripartite tricarboxylate transporter substrate binding protein [Acetobacteraceae bacterium]
MPLSRRGLLAGLSPLLAAPALAQGWPNRPIRLILPFAPGGAIDALARLLAERMSADLGQQVVVDPRPGANTVVGAEAAARAAPDGYTFMITTNSTHTNNPHLVPNLPYDPLRSFDPITLLSWGSVVFLAPAEAPYSGVPGFAAWARGRAEGTTYGSWGIGSAGHLYGALLARQSGARLEHVPYRGEQPAIADMIGGRLDTTFASPVGAKPQIEGGRVKALGSVGARRSPALPEVPTFGEQGMPGFDLPLFVAAWAPAGTPAEIRLRLREALARAAADERVRAQMLAQGQTPELSSPEALIEIVRRDVPRWGELIEISGARQS